MIRTGSVLFVCFLAFTAAERDNKLLSVFNVVTFPNDVCGASSGRNGTCLTESECSSKGGSSSGSCANGFGICCLFTLSCGGTSSSNNTYLTMSSTTSPTSPCKYTICKADTNICRIRFDFTTHVLATMYQDTSVALTATTGATSTAGAVGHCSIDQFSISGSPGSPVICGTNSGYHMIVDASDSCNDATFMIGASTSTSRSWDIWVTQYRCGEEDMSRAGPSGCLQYYTGTTGYLASFGFPSVGAMTSNLPASTTHLANQDYNICVRRALSACQICYTAIGSSSTTVAAVHAFGLSASGTAIVSDSNVNTGCLTDYITINGAAGTAGAVGTAATTKFCGRSLNSTVSTVAHATVCTRQTPFVVGVKTDDSEAQQNAIAANPDGNENQGPPGGIIGFGLVYSFPSATTC